MYSYWMEYFGCKMLMAIFKSTNTSNIQDEKPYTTSIHKARFFFLYHSHSTCFNPLYTRHTDIVHNVYYFINVHARIRFLHWQVKVKISNRIPLCHCLTCGRAEPSRAELIHCVFFFQNPLLCLSNILSMRRIERLYLMLKSGICPVLMYDY